MSRRRRKKRCAQPRRHRMRKQARRASASAWVRSGARVTVKTYAKRYGVDRYTAYDDLTAIGFPLSEADACWAVRPPPAPKPKRPQADPLPIEVASGIDGWAQGWAQVGTRRMFVVGFTSGGFPFGLYEDELGEGDFFEDEAYDDGGL